MPSPSDHDREVERQQRHTASVSASIARASRRATQDLSDDVLKILDTYVAKGGFGSRQEAQEYLRGYIEPKDRAVLIEAARRLPEPERTQQLTRLSSAAYSWRMSRAQAVDRAQQMAAVRLRREIEDRIRPVLDRTVTDSAKQAQFQMQKQIGFAYSFDLPNGRRIDQVVTGTGVYDKVRLFSRSEMAGVKETITQGMLSGRKAETLAREVRNQTGKQLYQARRLVRTTIAQASVDAKIKEFRELGIEEYEIVCTLDERTCPICSKYDGKRFELGKGPMPTFHPNCRCGVRQVLPDAVRGSLKRAARDSGGDSITVPATMQFDAWNKKFGTPSSQSKLDLQPQPAIAPPVSHTGKEMALLKKKHSAEVDRFVDSAPTFLRNAWDSTKEDLRIVSVTSETAYFSRLNRGVFLDIEKDVAESPVHAPYSTLFHELGHNMSAVYAARAGRPLDDFTQLFRSKKQTHIKVDLDTLEETEIGYTFSEIIRKEANDHISRHLKQLKAEATDKDARITSADACESLRRELMKIPPKSSLQVSDMFSGATMNRVRTTAYHTTKYWEDVDVGVEAFANMVSAAITNPDSLEAIKKYFPKSYDMFVEMIESEGRL